jgi:hypothetical protein
VLERQLRVFVSHSSRSEDDRRWLTALIGGMRTGDDAVVVLCDREEIAPGQRWREVIDHMLAECHAAVVLVTDEAMSSDWVLKEATIVRWRYDIEYDRGNRRPRFVLLPLVRPGLDQDELKRNRLWAPIGIDELQFLSSDDPAQAAAEVKRLLRPAARALHPSPLDLLSEEIASCIRDCGEARAREAIDRLGEPIA